MWHIKYNDTDYLWEVWRDNEFITTYRTLEEAQGHVKRMYGIA